MNTNPEEWEKWLVEILGDEIEEKEINIDNTVTEEMVPDSLLRNEEQQIVEGNPVVTFF